MGQPQRKKRWDSFFRKRSIEELFSNSLRIQKCLQTFPPPDKLDFVSSYLFGPVHSGKTIYGAQMMLEYIRKNYMEGKRTEGVEYIPLTELLLKIKQSYNSKNEIDEYSLIQHYTRLDFLLMDDIGTQYPTDWSVHILYLIINRRYEMQKITVFTSNLSLNELANNMMDDRIPSRIQAMCKTIKFEKQYL